MLEEPEIVVADAPAAMAQAEQVHVVAEEEVVSEPIPGDDAPTADASTVDDGPAVDDEYDGPTVDALQGRLADLQSAMDQLQSGDLDGAEATIAALESSLAAARQEHGLT